MSNFNQVPYLRTTRNFPEEPKQLTVEVNRSYVDIANAVNVRIIGIFPVNVQSLTGESWYINNNQRQQTLREVYTFTSKNVVGGVITIPHGINLSTFNGFTRIFGSFTDGTLWYPLPYVDAALANKQVSVIVNSTNIVITEGAGASPSITKGLIVLEWIGG